MKIIFRRIILPLILLALAVVLFVFGGINIKRQKSWIKTDAVITHLEYTPGAGDDDAEWKVVVAYDAEGVHYVAELDEYKSSFSEGQSVAVRYNPAEPGQVTADGIIGIIMMFACGALLIIGAALTFLRR